MKCYYGCESEELWQCKTCEAWYCQGHWHETSRGRNVECVACEGARQKREDEDPPRWAYMLDIRQVATKIAAMIDVDPGADLEDALSGLEEIYGLLSGGKSPWED